MSEERPPIRMGYEKAVEIVVAKSKHKALRRKVREDNPNKAERDWFRRWAIAKATGVPMEQLQPKPVEARKPTIQLSESPYSYHYTYPLGFGRLLFNSSNKMWEDWESQVTIGGKVLRNALFRFNPENLKLFVYCLLDPKTGELCPYTYKELIETQNVANWTYLLFEGTPNRASKVLQTFLYVADSPICPMIISR